ncbi:MAG: RluA family pseudouridine synthase [Nitrospirota bacterium]|nr:RluA family pseudouridine synthase [Nitrospirota bacterium]
MSVPSVMPGSGLTVQHQQVTPLFGLTVHHIDPDLVVVDKPAGVLMHRTHPRPQMFLQDLLGRELWQGGALYVVHRLDRETSGLVALARTPGAAAALGRQFMARRVAKRYLALVHGTVAADGAVDLPIGRAIGSLVRKKQQVHGRDAKTAVTHFRVLERRADLTLLEVTPEGGRLHQIRVHLAALGHPLVGDKLYGPDERWHLRFFAHGSSPEMDAALLLPRHALHASELAFEHPVDSTPLSFASPLPRDIQLFLSAFPAVPPGLSASRSTNLSGNSSANLPLAPGSANP